MTELSSYLQRVLAAMQKHHATIAVDAKGEPDPDAVRTLAAHLGENPFDVRSALLGLRATDCLMEELANFEGAEPLTFWTVHPQCCPD